MSPKLAEATTYLLISVRTVGRDINLKSSMVNTCVCLSINLLVQLVITSKITTVSRFRLPIVRFLILLAEFVILVLMGIF